MSIAVAIIISLLLIFFFWFVNTRGMETIWRFIFNAILIVLLVVFICKLLRIPLSGSV
jgi:hypothetical protein